MKDLFLDDYKSWFIEIKAKLKSIQQRTVVAINSALIDLYWDLGKMIAEKQAQAQWGDNILQSLSDDLKNEFPDSTGYSVRNLRYIKQFYQFYTANRQQVVADLRQQLALIP